jgi:hypothetical protein
MFKWILIHARFDFARAGLPTKMVGAQGLEPRTPSV